MNIRIYILDLYYSLVSYARNTTKLFVRVSFSAHLIRNLYEMKHNFINAFLSPYLSVHTGICTSVFRCCCCWIKKCFGKNPRYFQLEKKLECSQWITQWHCWLIYWIVINMNKDQSGGVLGDQQIDSRINTSHRWPVQFRWHWHQWFIPLLLGNSFFERHEESIDVRVA